MLASQVVAGWPTWVPVEDGRPGWALVSLPWVPYGGSGWIRLDARVAVVPLWTAVEIDSVQRTVTLAERGRRRVWPARLTRNSLTPRGRSLVLGEATSALGRECSGLLVAAHVLTDVSDGLEQGGAHRWAALIHDTAQPGGVRVPPDALSALLAAAPAGTSVLIN
jgi:hypothetical protein